MDQNILQEEDIVDIKEEKGSTKKLFHRIGICLSVMALVTIVIQVIIATLVENLNPSLANQPWYTWGLVFIGFHLIAFPVYLLLMKRIPDAHRTEDTAKISIGVGKMIKYFFICLSATYIFNILSTLLNYVIGLLKGGEVINPIGATVSSSGVVYTIIVGCILAPVIEEIVFRGVLINKLRSFDDKTIIWFTGLVFGLYHMNLYQFFYATVLGMIFAYITLKTKGIKHSIILHIIINLFGTTIFPTIINSGSEILAVVGALLVYIIMIVGFILALNERKKLVLVKGTNVLTKVDKRIKYCNIGMIIYIAICLIVIVSSIIA